MSGRHPLGLPAVRFAHPSNPIFAPVGESDDRAKRLAERTLEEAHRKRSRGEITLEGRATSTSEASGLAENISTPISDKQLQEICKKLRNLIDKKDLTQIQQLCIWIKSRNFPPKDLNQVIGLSHPVNNVVSQLTVQESELELLKHLFDAGFKPQFEWMVSAWAQVQKKLEDCEFEDIAFGGPSDTPSPEMLELEKYQSNITGLFLAHMDRENLKGLLLSLLRQLRQAIESKNQVVFSRKSKELMLVFSCLDDNNFNIDLDQFCDILAKEDFIYLDLLQNIQQNGSSLGCVFIRCLFKCLRSAIEQKAPLAHVQQIAEKIKSVAWLDISFARWQGRVLLKQLIEIQLEIYFFERLMICPLENVCLTLNEAVKKNCSANTIGLLIEALSREAIEVDLAKVFQISFPFQTYPCNTHAESGIRIAHGSDYLQNIDRYSAEGQTLQAQLYSQTLTQEQKKLECLLKLKRIFKGLFWNLGRTELDALESKLERCSFEKMEQIAIALIPVLGRARLFSLIFMLTNPELQQQEQEKLELDFEELVRSDVAQKEHREFALYAGLPQSLFASLLVGTTLRDRLSLVPIACRAQSPLSLFEELYQNGQIVSSNGPFVNRFIKDESIEYHIETAIQDESSSEVIDFLVRRMEDQHTTKIESLTDNASKSQERNKHEERLEKLFVTALKSERPKNSLNFLLTALIRAHYVARESREHKPSVYTNLLFNSIQKKAPSEIIIKIIDNLENPQNHHITQALQLLEKTSEDQEEAQKQDILKIISSLLGRGVEPTERDILLSIQLNISKDILMRMIRGTGRATSITLTPLNEILSFIFRRGEKAAFTPYSLEEIQLIVKELIIHGSKPDYYCISQFLDDLANAEGAANSSNLDIKLTILAHLSSLAFLQLNQLEELTKKYATKLAFSNENFMALLLGNVRVINMAQTHS